MLKEKKRGLRQIRMDHDRVLHRMLLTCKLCLVASRYAKESPTYIHKARQNTLDRFWVQSISTLNISPYTLAGRPALSLHYAPYPFFMAYPLSNLGDRSTDYLTSNHPNPPPADDFKSSYDDLIDQYAEPYSRISHHQTFKVQTPIDDSESRGPSYSLEHKPPFPSGKLHDEAEDPPGPPQSYPPKIKREKLVEHRKWWQQVRTTHLVS